MLSTNYISTKDFLLHLLLLLWSKLLVYGRPMAQYDASSVSYRMVNIPSRASLLQRALLILPTLTTPAAVPQSISIPPNDMMHMRKKAKSHVHDIDGSNYSVSRDLCGRMPSDISSLIIEYTITHDILQLGNTRTLPYVCRAFIILASSVYRCDI